MIGNVNDFTQALHTMNNGSEFCAVFVRSSDQDSVRSFLEVIKQAGMASQLAVLFSFENERLVSTGDWRRRLYHDQPDIRVQAAEMLADTSADEERDGVIRDLMEALTDSIAPVREAAMASLIALEAVTQLMAGLSDPAPELRRSAAWALGNMGTRARDAIPALIDCLRDSDDSVRRASAWALERIFSHEDAQLPAPVSHPPRKKPQRALAPALEGRATAESRQGRRINWTLVDETRLPKGPIEDSG
jgi:HEAT repeat protein